MDAQEQLYEALGDYRAGGRAQGIFETHWGGPGTVPALQDLGPPELLLDVLPFPPTPDQRSAIEGLGYWAVPCEFPEGLAYQHPDWPHRLLLLSHRQGHVHDQMLLWDWLGTDPQAQARYREQWARAGRVAADAALLPEAREAHAQATGFAPLQEVAGLLSPLDLPWMFAAGWAIDLLLGTPGRPHEDIDIIVPRAAQAEVQALLQAAGLHAQAVRDGGYSPWTGPLELPDHQVHVHRSGAPMLDLMLTDLSGGQWHYRRDPTITLPLAQARRVTAGGLPYLAPEAALLFKSATSDQAPRPKDQADFERARPMLDAAQRQWLADRLSADHPWRARLMP
ncbi:nucleotidyltransferase domain-containing protein [Deinococcus sonorensis]|uniref:Amino acid transporter n=2 Tax=Deinococcus sonorensis TaxID=309891 RepID=A0AAU7UER9_9DEIO